MQVLYKDENDCYAVMQVLKASYVPEVGVLELCGTEEDIAVKVKAKEAAKIVRELYEEDKADVSKYPFCEVELDDEDDDEFFDDDDDDDEDDFIDRMIDLDFSVGDKKPRIVFKDED